jgi:hypothetical protein
MVGRSSTPTCRMMRHEPGPQDVDPDGYGQFAGISHE